MVEGNVLGQAMRDMVASLQTPVVALLLALAAATAVLAGSAIVEWFVERRKLKVVLPQLDEELSAACGLKGAEGLRAVIARSGLLRRQRDALRELCSHPGFTVEQREALAMRLLEEEQSRCDSRLAVANVIAKLGPMLGLMGTLIPLGPGLLALGEGDVAALSESLIVAFDTTVTGLLCAAVAVIVAAARRRWYDDYVSLFEAVEEHVLEELALLPAEFPRGVSGAKEADDVA